jgi:uncharacterized protein YjbJ (UPF0337 family)
MDKDRVKGAVNDAAGRVKRQVGEWTGDTNAQAEGTAQQIKGKAQKAWGTLKDAARDANKNVKRDGKNESTSQDEPETEVEAETEPEHVHSGDHR